MINDINAISILNETKSLESSNGNIIFTFLSLETWVNLSLIELHFSLTLLKELIEVKSLSHKIQTIKVVLISDETL